MSSVLPSDSSTEKWRFVQAFNRLAVATRLAEGEVDGAMPQIYWDGLHGLTIEAIEAAAVELAETAVWFPKLAEWRAAAKKIRREDTRQALLTGEVQQPEPSISPRDLQEAVRDYMTMRAEGVPREDAERGFTDMLKAFLIPGREAEWHHECEACEDSGWELRTCYPDQGPACGVRKCKRAGEHSYAVACACRETNRTYQRKRAMGW